MRVRVVARGEFLQVGRCIDTTLGLNERLGLDGVTLTFER